MNRAAAGRLRTAAALLAAALAPVACAEKRVAAPTAQAAAPAGSETWRRFAPACRLDGCCAGHGEVAYLQPDKFVMCTDGETSQICDCH